MLYVVVLNVLGPGAALSLPSETQVGLTPPAAETCAVHARESRRDFAKENNFDPLEWDSGFPLSMEVAR